MSASRGIKSVTIYTDDDEALMDSVTRTEDQITATELARLCDRVIENTRVARERTLHIAQHRAPEHAREMMKSS